MVVHKAGAVQSRAVDRTGHDGLFGRCAYNNNEWGNRVGRVGIHMTLWTACAAVIANVCVAGAAKAGDPLPARFSMDARLRYEHVQSDAFVDDADALTLRVRPAVDAPLSSSVSIIGELDVIAALSGEYDEVVGAREPLPVIADAPTIELNRLALDWAVREDARLILGRQRIEQDDERFVGDVGFRQNDQTFDAARLDALIAERVSVDLSHVWAAHRPFGERSRHARFDGSHWLANVSASSPLGQVSAFGQRHDFQDGDPIAFDTLETLGVRLDGARHRDEWGLEWEAGLAAQSGDTQAGANTDADYALVGVSGYVGRLRAGLRREVLGAGEAAGAPGFSTPFATLHAFQGAADVFLTTPTDGVVDTSAAVSVGVLGTQGVRSPTLRLAYHDFDADRGGADLGAEFNASLRVGVVGMGASVAYARYEADTYGADVDKLWLTVSRRY